MIGTTTIAVLEIGVEDETTTDDTAADDEASRDDEGLAIMVAVGAIVVVVDVPVITPENAHVSRYWICCCGFTYTQHQNIHSQASSTLRSDY